jgi:hypothetical protein
MLRRLWWWKKSGEELKRRVTRHMGGPCDQAESISHPIKPIERVSLQLALDQWLERNERPGQLLGYAATLYHRVALAHLLTGDSVTVAPVEREQFSRGPGDDLDCVTRGLYLLHHLGQPVTVLVHRSDNSMDVPTLEILARERRTAQGAMNQLLAEVNRHTAYKGKTLFLEVESWPRQVLVRFRELPPVRREAIILPDAVLEVVERNVLGLIKHGAVLRQSGRSTRRGVLLHGPPGTGKTLMLRYLAHACPDHTVILLSARQTDLIRESCEVARLLAPALILLEDVDLVAQEREQNRCPMVLHDLMDEMDGLGPKSDCIFLLTSNRPEVLEPALSARPGRIDQAVEFPLPDEHCRRRLLALYGEGLDLGRVDLDRWVEKTHGVSPAFIEELLRKAALMAAERGETAVPLPLQDGDIEQALRELIYFGGELTQKLLGYRPFGYRPSAAGV